MSKRRGILYIFNLENTQEEYSKCLEFISILQGHTSITEDSARLERLQTLAEEIEITGMFVPEYPKNYYEQPLTSATSSQVLNKKQAKKVEGKNISNEILKDPPFSQHFHIRVHLMRPDVVQTSYLADLHYLGLFLQGLDHILTSTYEQKNVQGGEAKSETFKRASVFIVPFSGENYPFQSADGGTDFDTYKTVSTYLRLLAKRYTGNIYGVVEQSGRIVVRALDFHRPARLPDYLPLIPLNEETYPKLFDEIMTLDELKALFSLQKNRRFANANHTDPYKALGDYITETAYAQFNNTLRGPDGKANAHIATLIQHEVQKWCGSEQICRLAFAIFLFTLRVTTQDDESIRTSVQENLAFANELSAGLRQIAQNALQHSACHEGIFSFYLKRPKEADSNQKPTLRVLLSDFNDQQSFLDNFSANLRREAGYAYNEKLKQCYLALSEQKKFITLGYFLGEYPTDSPIDSWVNFRRLDSSAHIGLLLFSLTMQRCKGELLLATGANYSITAQNCFSHSYGENSSGPSDLQSQKLPGTQLALTIPVDPIENLRPSGLGQLSSTQPLQEAYSSFAFYLDYQPQELIFSGEEFIHALNSTSKLCRGELLGHMSMADPAMKSQTIHTWKECWVAHSKLDARSNSVYFLDVAKLPSQYLNSADSIEIFLKGFFDAMDELCKAEQSLFLALVNVSELFLTTFRQITISLALHSFSSGLQIYVVKSDLSESIHFMGNTFAQAIRNAYTLSLEHGNQAYSSNEAKRAEDLVRQAMGTAKSQSDPLPLGAVCPFDVILPEPNQKVLSLFDERLRQIAEHPMDAPPWGYKLKNTHMRLGSKVHIRSFFEMAFLFYRTSIADRVAFEVLKKLGDRNSLDESINLLHDDLLFYGYASYSKALLTSMLEILKAYRAQYLKKRLEDAQKAEDQAAQDRLKSDLRQIPQHLAFASYQHNLQSDFQVEDTELYFNFYDSFLGEKIAKNRVRFCRPVKIIQIVPISSTLTTFNKMEDRMQAEVVCAEADIPPKTVAKYTVFWVTDQPAESESIPRPGTEDKYWKRVEPSERKIYLCSEPGLHILPITYFMRAPVVWEDPLQCELCYPENVIAEVPLMETDQTSTVPTQQLRGQNFSLRRPKDDHGENDRRLLNLESCVTYGHVRREKNHFQFYLETQNYFNKVSEDVRDWLTDLRNTAEPTADTGPILNIIFSPEHATNVGFAQYVNNYYFDGNAEIVCVNEGKEFRSNFKCEHLALSKTIRELLDAKRSEAELPVQFYFVDDTIITGETFFKAVSFLHSLIPAQYQGKFPTNLIKKCFLLVDRLSIDSKQAYVKDVKKDFHAFLHIDLSNMRVQGDSCVGCKLELNAKKLQKRSATKNIERYWSHKVTAHEVHGYSQYTGEQDDTKRAKAFQKLVLAHIAQNVLFYDNKYFELGKIYDSLLAVLAEILGEKSDLGVEFQYGTLMQELHRRSDQLELIKDFLKLVSRPFFSFDFKVKLQTLTLLLIFAEFLINDTFSAQTLEDQAELQGNEYKAFLFENKRIAETFRLLQLVREKYLTTKDSQIDFLQDCLIDNLVELRSTYMMRKTTIAKLMQFLSVEAGEYHKEHPKAEVFWREYVAGVHQIMDCNSDETRTLWLEHLLISGDEYREFQKKSSQISSEHSFAPQSLFETLTRNWPMDKESAFCHFCYELFLQNNRVLFDGIESSLKDSTSKDTHFVNYWRQGRMLDRFQRHQSSQEDPSEAEKNLFLTLENPDCQGGQYKVTVRYRNLLDKIIAMAQKKYGFKGIDIALLTWRKEDGDNEEVPEIGRLDIVSSVLESSADHHFNKYEIKKKLVDTLRENQGLKQYGYQALWGTEKAPACFFIYFDSEENSIIPVYLYFRCSRPEENAGFQLMLLLRDILSYRNRFLKMLKSDFAGDTFSKFAHTWGERSILAHEKATSHNTTGDDRVILEVFLDPKSTSKYRVLDSDQVMKWLLLHTYNNAQIAKLFNRNYGSGEKHENADNFPDAPPLYLEDVSREEIKTLSWFERPLRSFSDLRLLEDGRFTLLDTVVTLNTKAIKDAQFLSQNGRFYNVEYFKTIFIDIIISAMKFATSSVSYLERVDTYLEDAGQLRHDYLLEKETVQMLRNRECLITCTIEDSEDTGYRYLVIRNRVNKSAHNLFDWQTHNQIIQARLASPIDHADGHMSLLAISQYIEGLDPMLHQKTSFEYCEEEGELVFVTKLPVIRKG